MDAKWFMLTENYENDQNYENDKNRQKIVKKGENRQNTILIKTGVGRLKLFYLFLSRFKILKVKTR